MSGQCVENDEPPKSICTITMIGFEIIINEEEVIAVASDSLVSVVMSISFLKYNYLSITGMDSKSYHLDWHRRELRIGDKIHVRVAEINKINPLRDRRPSDREEMIKRYYDLKQELEEKGLI